jgi:preprotein translocase subunit Sec61beta
MVVKQQSVSMPMASAGIVGFSPDVKVSAREIEPKMLIIATALLVLIVKVASIVSGY